MPILRWLACLLLSGVPAGAESLCGLTDGTALLDRLEGAWTGQTRRSLVNESLDRSTASGEVEVTIRDGAIMGPLLADLVRDPLPLVLAEPEIYDVDAVDDVLDTTGHAALADALSDTPCGPERLPQLVATVSESDGATFVRGSVTLVAYFDDRLLRVVELELSGSGAILFLTETTLLRPAS